MRDSICGADCIKCSFKDGCGGCIKTNGRPFNGECIVAKCCQSKENNYCENCLDMPCKLKEQLMTEFNALGIKDMPEITSLNALNGSFVNLEYTLPSGQTVKLLDDTKIYLGNQICKSNSNRCYGIVADEEHLLVCEYGDCGSDAEIVIYKKRNA